jgi:hypothetical protein
VRSRLLVVLAAARCFVKALGRIASRLKKAACNVGSRRATGTSRGFAEDGLGLVQVQAWRRVERRDAHWASERPSDWARRNLRSLRDGAAGFNAGGIADAGGESLRCWLDLGSQAELFSIGVRSRGLKTVRILVSALHGCGHSLGCAQIVHNSGLRVCA